MQYVGIDWGTRGAAWCAVDERGELLEGAIPAEEDGLARLVHTLGPEVSGCVEMISGAVWVGERLRAVWLAVSGRRRAEGQGDRAAGVQDRSGRRECSRNWRAGISCPRCGSRQCVIESCVR